MRSSLLLFCVLGALVVTIGASPRKPVWPRQFDVSFGLSVVPSAINEAIVNVTSHLYYNFELQASLITYPEVCIPGIIAGDGYKKGCNLLFVPKGTYLLAPKAGVDCCLLFPGVGTIPPEFLKGFNASGYVFPAADLFGVLHTSDFWVTNDGFFYWTDAANGHDVALVDGGVIVWNFHPDMRVAPQPANLFQVPAGCSLSCPTSTVMLDKLGGRIDPMISLALHHHRLAHSV